MRAELGFLMRRYARGALRREAVTAFSVFVLLLNVLTGTLWHTHHDAAGLALSLDGNKMAICSGTQMAFIDKDGNTIPVPQQRQHECACCLLMQASAVIPPPPPGPAPLELAAIQILRPHDAERLDAASVQARRNRDPPFQA
jgi:hypothetical protein